MTKGEFLQACEVRYDELRALGKLDNFYDYEKEFVSIWQGIGRDVFEKNLGAVPRDKRKKNLTTLGWAAINNTHPFSKGNNGFQISSLMQEKMVYVGHLDCYEKSNEILEKLVSVKVSASQIYRVTDLYGVQIGKITDPKERTLTPVMEDDVLYVEADGGMILIRKDDWKEVKVGRLFKSGDCIHADEKPGYISHSQYKAHLGNSKKLFAGKWRI